MSEEYKKLSELPQAVTPKKCEAYGIENGKSVRVPLTFATPEEITSLNEKIISNANAITTIRNTIVKSAVSNNELFNNVVKELYFDNEFDVSQVAEIHIKRNGSSAEAYNLWELYLIDKARNYHWTNFTRSAETQDVNTGVIGWSKSTLWGDELKNKIRVYAVIDWDKITDQQGINNSDYFALVLSKDVLKIKYHPVIYTFNKIVGTISEE